MEKLILRAASQQELPHSPGRLVQGCLCYFVDITDTESTNYCYLGRPLVATRVERSEGMKEDAGAHATAPARSNADTTMRIVVYSIYVTITVKFGQIRTGDVSQKSFTQDGHRS